MTGAIYTWGLQLAAGLRGEELLRIMERFKLDTVIDLRRAAGLGRPIEPDAVGRLYSQAREGRRILLVCSHAEPRRCHRHAELALPIAQDAANYARARRESKIALPVRPIDVKHVLGDLLVDPLEYEEAVAAGRNPKGKKWR